MPQVKRKSNPQALANLNKLVRGFKEQELKVGWFESDRYDNAQKTPVAAVAARNEFGSQEDNIPPRPFMRPTIKRRQKEWAKFIQQGSKRILAGSASVAQILETLGLNTSGEIGRSIEQVYSPPLAEATIKARIRKRANKQAVGNLDKPLVDFGIMQKSVTYTVSKDANTR